MSVVSTLTGAERAQVVVAIHDAVCGCDNDPVIYPPADDALAVVEAILAARETALRESIAQEIETASAALALDGGVSAVAGAAFGLAAHVARTHR